MFCGCRIILLYIDIYIYILYAMSASNRGGKSGRDKTSKSTHSLQNGKLDTSVAGIKNQV